MNHIQKINRILQTEVEAFLNSKDNLLEIIEKNNIEIQTEFVKANLYRFINTPLITITSLNQENENSIKDITAFWEVAIGISHKVKGQGPNAISPNSTIKGVIDNFDSQLEDGTPIFSENFNIKIDWDQCIIE